MISSMTGYGRNLQELHNRKISVEIKAVNHRYLDINVHAPRAYAFIEEHVKATINSAISRGKVDVYVFIEESEGNNELISVNKDLLDSYMDAFASIKDTYKAKDEYSIIDLIRLPDVLEITKEEANQEEVIQDVSSVLEVALSDFNVMRRNEGQKLAEDVLSRSVTIENIVSYIEERSPAVVSEYREKLYTRLKEVLEDKNIDEQRMLLEAAIFADKTAVNEETVRLKSHLSQLREMLKSGAAIGRKLDFLIQEFNREANTIGSKCNDIEISKKVIDLKSEIEKIREQIQNIE